MRRLLLGLLFASGPALAQGDDWFSGDYDSPIVSSGPLTTSGHLPRCLGDPLCAMQFTVGADGGWNAITGNGRDYSADMNQGTAPTWAATQFQAPGVVRYARTNISDTSAGYLPAAAAVDAGLAALVTGDHTVQCAYWAGAGTTPRVFSYGAYPSDGMYMTATTTAATYWIGADGGAASRSSAVSPVGQWVVQTAYRNGTTFDSRANGVTGASAVSLVVPPPTTRNLYLGRLDSAGTPLGGAHLGCTLWYGARSDANLTRDEASVTGAIIEQRNITTTRPSSGCWEPDAGAAQVACMGVNAARIDGRGLFSYEGQASAVPGALSAWSLIAHANKDGGVNPNPTRGAAGSCPYPDPMAGLTAVKIDFPAVSDVGSGPTGFSLLWTSFIGTTAPWTQDVFIRGCDAADGGVLYWGAQGGTTVYTPLDAGPTWSRYTMPFTGAAVSYAWVGPDTTIAGQPTSQPALCACLWAPKAALGSVAGPPVVCGSAPCSSANSSHLYPSAGLPVLSGRVGIHYMPKYTIGQARCIIDTIASNNGLRLCVAADNTLVLTLGDGSATATTTSAALTWTGETDYWLEVLWGGGNARVFKAGALVASTLNGSQKIPRAHATNIALGSLIDGTSSANGWTSYPVWSLR